MNIALISLGSNMTVGEKNMRDAISRIEEKAHSCRFSGIYETEPEGEHRHAKYKNCVGEIYTHESAEEWLRFFKELETAAGRNDALRKVGNVPLDIDLVQWNDEVLRPKDLAMDYMKTGLSELSNQ
ncbi:MAG: 2-amino-4-hydroxy-6-hydroxymethyldihydropteridine diphosphokinase [Bacteroidales bacterium]